MFWINLISYHICYLTSHGFMLHLFQNCWQLTWQIALTTPALSTICYVSRHICHVPSILQPKSPQGRSIYGCGLIKVCRNLSSTVVSPCVTYIHRHTSQSIFTRNPFSTKVEILTIIRQCHNSWPGYRLYLMFPAKCFFLWYFTAISIVEITLVIYYCRLIHCII